MDVPLKEVISNQTKISETDLDIVHKMAIWRNMRSDNIKKGLERAPHRSLLKAIGLTDIEIGKPIIAANSQTKLCPVIFILIR